MSEIPANCYSWLDGPDDQDDMPTCTDSDKCGHCWFCQFEPPCDEHGHSYCPTCIAEDDLATAWAKVRVAEKLRSRGIVV